MSSHPNPGNRSAYIAKEASALTIGKPADEQPVRAHEGKVRIATPQPSRRHRRAFLIGEADPADQRPSLDEICTKKPSGSRRLTVDPAVIA